MDEWKLVPVEPTDEMLDALHDSVLIKVDTFERTAEIINDKAWWATVLAAAPVPPAGEVEVLAVAWIKVTRPDKRGNAYELDWYSAAERLPVGEYELVDEAHVTRLTAENARLQAEHLESLLKLADRIHEREKERDALRAEVERKQKTIDGMNQMHAESVEYFQSELTKARELLSSNSIGLDSENWYGETPDGDSALLIRADVLAAMKREIEQLCKHPSMSFHQVALLEGVLAHQSAPVANPIACKVDESCGQDGRVNTVELTSDQYMVAPAAKGGE